MEANITGSTKSAGQASASRTYRAGTGIAVATSLLTVWTTVVRDDGNGIGFFMLIMAAAVGAFTAELRPIGLARTMAGVAIMQLLLGMLIATAPVTAATPGGALKIVVSSACLALLWLASAACFRTASRRGR